MILSKHQLRESVRRKTIIHTLHTVERALGGGEKGYNCLLQDGMN